MSLDKQHPHLVLVGRLCAGDEHIFVIFYRQHHGAIWLKVKVLLSTQLDGALQHMISSWWRCRAGGVVMIIWQQGVEGEEWEGEGAER